MGRKQRAIYSADTWHVEEGTASDGSGRAPHHNPVRRVFSAEYKLAILAEYDACSETGEKGAILRREGLCSSLITDWRRQHRQGLLKAAVGRSDGGRGGPSLSEVAKLRADNERLRTKLAQAEAVIDVQEKCTRSWRRSRRARPPTSSRGDPRRRRRRARRARCPTEDRMRSPRPRRGIDVLGIEPDPRMAAIARQHGLVVEEATCEGWAAKGRTFDLLAAGEAWHWIDPARVASQAIATVRPGGWFAAVATIFKPNPVSAMTLDTVSRRLAPSLDPPSTWAEHGLALMAAISGRGLPRFGRCETQVFTEPRSVSVDRWIGRFFTSNLHLRLETEARSRLATAVADSFEGEAAVAGTEETVVVIAERL
jgi:transposase-like protein